MFRLLLVEDDPILLDVLRQAFTRTGWEVEGVQTVADALAAFERMPPDVVLTDKNLPTAVKSGITTAQAGVDLVRTLRQRDAAVGIVMMTGYGTAESARDTLNLGIDEYVEKPFPSLSEVLTRLDALAVKARARRAAQAVLAPQPGPGGDRTLTILVAATGKRQSAILAVLGGHADRVLPIINPDEIKPSAKSEGADVVILDGSSFPEEVTCLVVQVKTRIRSAACVVLSQHLPLADIKRLIELEVRALIEAPVEDERFADELRHVIKRVRRLPA